MFKGILMASVLAVTLGCATDQLEVDPDIDPGNSVGVKVKSCFSDKALESPWGLGVPKLWNAINGCEAPAEELEAVEAPEEIVT